MAATVVALATRQTNWTKEDVADLVDPLDSEGEYDHKLTLPSTGNAIFKITLDGLTESNCLALMFYGIGSADEVNSARVWGISTIQGTDPEYIGEWLADLDLAFGGTLPNNGIFAHSPAYRHVKNVEITADRTNTPPAIRIVGHTEGVNDSGFAMLFFDAVGYSHIIVQFDASVVDSELGLLWRVF